MIATASASTALRQARNGWHRKTAPWGRFSCGKGETLTGPLRTFSPCPSTTHVLGVLTFAAISAGWQAIVIIVQSHTPIAIRAAILALSRFLTNVIHGNLRQSVCMTKLAKRGARLSASRLGHRGKPLYPPPATNFSKRSNHFKP